MITKKDFDEIVKYLNEIGFELTDVSEHMFNNVHTYSFMNTLHVRLFDEHTSGDMLRLPDDKHKYWCFVHIDKYYNQPVNTIDDLKVITNKELDKYIKRYENMIAKYQAHVNRYQTVKEKIA